MDGIKLIHYYLTSTWLWAFVHFKCSYSANYLRQKNHSPIGLKYMPIETEIFILSKCTKEQSINLMREMKRYVPET